MGVPASPSRAVWVPSLRDRQAATSPADARKKGNASEMNHEIGGEKP
jgi:hypothetical protein